MKIHSRVANREKSVNLAKENCNNTKKRCPKLPILKLNLNREKQN